MCKLNELGSKACDIHASLSCLVSLLDQFDEGKLDAVALGLLVKYVADDASTLANDLFKLELDQKH